MQLLIQRKCPEGQREGLLWILLDEICQPGIYLGPHLCATEDPIEEVTWALYVCVCMYIYVCMSVCVYACIHARPSTFLGRKLTSVAFFLHERQITNIE